MASVTIVLSADDARLLQAQQRQLLQQEKLIAKYEKASAKANEGSKRAAEAAKAQETFTASAQATATASITSIQNWIGAYASVQGAIGLVTDALANQTKRQQEALDLAVALGKAQQETAKNLSGLTTVEKQQALADVGDIQSKTGFPNRAVLNQALGDAYSASGGKIELAKEAVAVSAQLTLLTPEATAQFSGALIDVANAAKASAEESAGFLLDVGAASRIVDPNMIAKNIAPALSAAIATVPSQDPKLAAAEAAGAFATLTNASADATGESSATAFVTLTGKMQEFFANLQAQRAKAGEDLTATITKRDREALNIEKQKLQQSEIQAEIARFGSVEAGTPRAAELAELQVREKETSLNIRQAEEAITADNRRIAELEKQVLELSKLKETPATFGGRVEVFRQNPGLRQEFLKTPFGEAKFQTAIESILTAGSDLAQQAQTNTQGIDFKTDTTKNQIAEINRGLTPMMATAVQKAKYEAEKERRASNPDQANIGLVATIADETLRATRPNNIFGFGGAALDPLNKMQIESAGTPVEAIGLAKDALKRRSEDIQAYSFTGQMSQSDLAKLRDIEFAQIRLSEMELAVKASTGEMQQQGPMRGRNPSIGTTEPMPVNQPIAPQAAQVPAEIRVNDSGITTAADKMAKAAEQMQDAAARMNQPPSMAPAARAQAATVR